MTSKSLFRRNILIVTAIPAIKQSKDNYDAYCNYIGSITSE